MVGPITKVVDFGDFDLVFSDPWFPPQKMRSFKKFPLPKVVSPPEK